MKNYQKCSTLNEKKIKKRPNQAALDNPTSSKKIKMVNPHNLAGKKIAAFNASNELMDLVKLFIRQFYT